MQKILIFQIAFCLANTAFAADPEAPPTPELTDPTSFTPTNSYVHDWIKMPEVSGQSVRDSSSTTIRSHSGQVSVVIFLASYDEPSQQLILDFLRIERKYQPLHANFFYVFSHDTRDDALGFMEEFKIKDGILSNHEILKQYHNPDLPTIYIGDRNGWLTRRFKEFDTQKIAELEVFLKHATAL